jgi:Tfp pilus assembly protein PilF
VLSVQTQNYSQAEEQFKTCVRVAPDFDQAYLNLARLYAMRGDKNAARAIVQDLLRIQPENAGARQAMELLQ